MPILFTGNGKVWKDQELAAAIHYLTPSPPLSPHTSLTPTTCFRVLTIFLSPYPTRTPRLWRACGLICSKNLLSISAWFQFEVLALVLWSPMTRSHPGIKMVLPMSSSAPVSTVLALLSGYWIWMDRLVYLGESSVQFWVWSITIWRKLQLFFLLKSFAWSLCGGILWVEPAQCFLAFPLYICAILHENYPTVNNFLFMHLSFDLPGISYGRLIFH